MKKFWKVVLAVICGIIICNVLTVLFLLGIGSSVGSGKQPAVPSQGILKLDFSKITVAEQSRDLDLQNIQGLLGGGAERTAVGILDATAALRAAAQDPGVKALYIKTDAVSAGIAGAEEMRAAISAFRASGKPVVSYFENPTTVTVYLASAADRVLMSSCEGGTPMFTGVSTQLMFYKDLLDKLGIRIQLIRHGKYKSAGEPYIRSSASKANLEQNQELINSIWATYGTPIAESRHLTVAQLDALINNLKLCVPDDFVREGLVDATVSRGELQNTLAVMAGVADFGQVQFIPFADYAAAKATPNIRAHKKIAILYADGQIVDGYDPENVNGDRFASIIADIRADSTVKAVVLRVNSPGGSVVASEKIKTELDLLKAEKPVVASYGNYAASGGYWISNGSTKIFSDAATLTGSIGVFGMIPDISGLLKDHAHVGVESVSSHAHGDMLTLTRPLTAEETAWMQRSIEGIYTKFIGTVAEGRGMTPDEVDAIAQGRVWTGADALKIGLVDEIGTLADALDWTAALAGDPVTEHWHIAAYPRQRTLVEQITAAMEGGLDSDYSVQAAQRWYDEWLRGAHSYAFALMPFVLR